MAFAWTRSGIGVPLQCAFRATSVITVGFPVATASSTVLPTRCAFRLHDQRSSISTRCHVGTVYASSKMPPSSGDVTGLFVPVAVRATDDDINVGEELTGAKLKKDGILSILNTFYKRPHLRQLAEENGLDNRLLQQAFASFRRFCTESESLPVDLHVVCSDILQKAGHVDDLFPYFMRHARQIFPHLDCMEELKLISDLRLPANWYPEARAINRKIVFHAGPTNSGKTHHAIERFLAAKSGVYCGPLKLLAVEVHGKTNARGTPCDLITGEERRFALPDRTPASHVACTVEMTSVTTSYEVAVIDEIQMMRDQQRGWAWTRALLGIAADEVHVCGEVAAIDFVRELCGQIGEMVEVRKYKRLTTLTVQDTALETLDNVQPGDCIVCFSKNDVYHVSRTIEKLGHDVAVIYGGLPPGTKLAQANRFNDPLDKCKILVATDAIGMGINLSIRRIIFFSLIKPLINEKGEKEMDTIPTYQALQIAGRAGRFGTEYSQGFVTTLRHGDLNTLKRILSEPVKEIEAAGLHPTAEQIELFAYHLPHATLSNLMDIFVSICVVDDARYFMCNVDDFKFLADMIQHVPLSLRARYVFCCSPINRKMPFVCTMFLKFARQYSRNDPVTLDWLCHSINWPFNLPQNIIDLVHLEAVFDVLDLYLWLSYRFPDLFPDAELVRDMQHELDEIIQVGVANITKLLIASESTTSSDVSEESFVMKRKTQNFVKGKSILSPKATAIESSQIVGDKVDDDDDDVDDDDGENVRSRSSSSSSFMDIQQYLKLLKDTNSPSSSPQSVSVGKGKLAERLVEQGVLTAQQLQEMQRDWQRQGDDAVDKSSRSARGRPKKRPK